MNRTEFVKDFATGIARMEGFYSTRSISARNNNPGNIRTWGDNPVDKGYVKFPTEAAGWKALTRQINLNIDRKLTMREFFGGKKNVYAGYANARDKNDPGNYARFVAQRLGIQHVTMKNGKIKENVDRVLLDCFNKETPA